MTMPEYRYEIDEFYFRSMDREILVIDRIGKVPEYGIMRICGIEATTFDGTREDFEDKCNQFWLARTAEVAKANAD